MNIQTTKLLLLLTLLTIAACSPQSNSDQRSMHAPEVDIANPLKMTITEWDEYTGRFQALQEVTIRARVSGYLDEINFVDGQGVKKGQTLFVIDQRPFKIALDSAQASFNLANRELKRAESLRKSRAISQEDVDRRLQEYLVAKSSLELAKLNLEFTEVKSPIDGRASRNLVSVGNLISGGTQDSTELTTVVTLDPIHFYFEGAERELLRYQRLDQTGNRSSSRTASNPVSIKLQDETEFTRTGVTDFVDNHIDNSTGTISARAIFDNKDHFIQPGMFGRIRLLGHAEFEALLLPDVAISTNQSLKFVYVLNDQNVAQRREVIVGRLYTKDLRVIESGLSADDRVVVNGLQRIRGETVVSAVQTSIETPPLPIAVNQAEPTIDTDKTDTSASVPTDSDAELETVSEAEPEADVASVTPTLAVAAKVAGE